MARLRTLKPSFFTNDTLAELPPIGRLLFQGLWCIADREGRLEDRPRKIKAEVLPYDDVDADALLDALQKHGFILRYVADQQRYIQVVNFTKHQSPHKMEAASTIPAPVKHDASTVQAPCDDGLIVGSGEWDPIVGSGEGPEIVADAPPPDNFNMAMPPTPIKALSRKTRIPDDYPITPKMRDWARDKFPDLDIEYAHEEFCTYWRGSGGTNADWYATWQNGMLKANKIQRDRAPRFLSQAEINKARPGKFVGA